MFGFDTLLVRKCLLPAAQSRSHAGAKLAKVCEWTVQLIQTELWTDLDWTANCSDWTINYFWLETIRKRLGKRLGLNHKLIHFQGESQTDWDLFAYSFEKFTEKSSVSKQLAENTAHQIWFLKYFQEKCDVKMPLESVFHQICLVSGSVHVLAA